MTVQFDWAPPRRPRAGPMATRIVPPFDVDAAWERVVRRVIAGLVIVAAFLFGVAVGIIW